MRKKSPLQLSLVLPCFNELEHIKVSLAEIENYVQLIWGSDGAEIILVDDGSTDGTREFLKSLPERAGRRVILNAKNLGRGGTVKVGLRHAAAPISGFMDIDREVSESYLPKFFQKIKEGADLVLGVRSYKFSPSLSGLVRWGTHEGYRFLSRRVIETKLHDTEVGYKFFSPRARRLALKSTRNSSWFWDTEVTLLCEKAGYRCEEIPVLFQKNLEKTSTVRIVRDSLSYLKSLRDFSMRESP